MTNVILMQDKEINNAGWMLSNHLLKGWWLKKTARERKGENAQVRKERRLTDTPLCSWHFLYHTGSCKQLIAPDCNTSVTWECEGRQKKNKDWIFVNVSEYNCENTNQCSCSTCYVCTFFSGWMTSCGCDESSSSEAFGVSESSLLKGRVKWLWFCRTYAKTHLMFYCWCFM